MPTRRSERAGPVPAGLIAGPVRVSAYMDGYTPDGHGLVGPLPAAPNVWMFGGFSGHGFKLAPASARSPRPDPPRQDQPAHRSPRPRPLPYLGFRPGRLLARHGACYSSWRRHHMPVSWRPSGARSSHWYMPQAPAWKGTTGPLAICVRRGHRPERVSVTASVGVSPLGRARNGHAAHCGRWLASTGRDGTRATYRSPVRAVVAPAGPRRTGQARCAGMRWSG